MSGHGALLVCPAELGADQTAGKKEQGMNMTPEIVFDWALLGVGGDWDIVQVLVVVARR